MHRAVVKILALVGILVVLPAFGSGERLFAPGIDPWPHWDEHVAGSDRRVDHSAWDGFLKIHLHDRNGPNLIAYGSVPAPDRAALKDYLRMLQSVMVRDLNRNEQLAYWVNLYNALTVDLILDHYPVVSIRDIDISPGLFARGPWDAKLVTIDGLELSLNDIEHRIIRAIWRDPRIHYLVNCASIGCPDLAPAAYTGANIEPAMKRAAESYVNDPRGVTIVAGRVTVSRIYDWFIEDFGGSEQGVIAHLKQHARPELSRALDAAEGLDDTHYDWALNDLR